MLQIVKNEWDTEPDSLDFKSSGLQCAMRRSPVGCWCGYVGVEKSHPWYEKSYSDEVKVSSKTINRTIDIDKIGAINLLCSKRNIKSGLIDIVLAIDVHGGLTYSADHAPGEKARDKWWFGFDCAHSGDFIPRASSNPHVDEVYRNAEYVKSECRNLAKQLMKQLKED